MPLTNKPVFSLKKHKATGELHLFEATRKISGCDPQPESLCKNMALAESSGNVFGCATGDEARMKCAKGGRKVCGACLILLYTDY